MKKFATKVAIIGFMLLAVSSYVQAEETQTPKLVTNPEKAWTVTFNVEMDESTITTESVFIEKEDGTKIVAELRLENARTLIVKPEAAYQENTIYQLHIKETLEATNQQALKTSYTQPFIYQKEKPQEIEPLLQMETWLRPEQVGYSLYYEGEAAEAKAYLKEQGVEKMYFYESDDIVIPTKEQVQDTPPYQFVDRFVRVNLRSGVTYDDGNMFVTVCYTDGEGNIVLYETHEIVQTFPKITDDEPTSLAGANIELVNQAYVNFSVEDVEEEAHYFLPLLSDQPLSEDEVTGHIGARLYRMSEQQFVNIDFTYYNTYPEVYAYLQVFNEDFERIGQYSKQVK